MNEATPGIDDSDELRPETVAVHEAGHAVLVLHFGIPLDSVTIAADSEGGVAGSCEHEGYHPDAWTDVELDTREALLTWLNTYEEPFRIVAMGGSAAEEIAFGHARWDEAMGDRNGLYDIIDSSGRWHLGVDSPPSADASYAAEVERATEDAKRLLRRHWPAVQALAAALLRDETLDGETALAIVDEADPTLNARPARARWATANGWIWGPRSAGDEHG